MVSYEVRSGGPIVFTVVVDGFGLVPITSRRPGVFSGRERNREALTAALRGAEDFAEKHKAELAPLYAAIAAQNAA